MKPPRPVPSRPAMIGAQPRATTTPGGFSVKKIHRRAIRRESVSAAAEQFLNSREVFMPVLGDRYFPANKK